MEPDDSGMMTLIRYCADGACVASPYAATGLPRLVHCAMPGRAIDAITRLGHDYAVEWPNGTS